MISFSFETIVAYSDRPDRLPSEMKDLAYVQVAFFLFLDNPFIYFIYALETLPISLTSVICEELPRVI